MSGRTLASAKPISFRDPKFWNKLQLACKGKKTGFFKASAPNGSPLLVVSMEHSIKMIPFVRTAEELFSKTASTKSKVEKFAVVINGPTYGLTNSGKVDALIGDDPVAAKETLQQGRIVLNGKIIGGSKSNMYFIQNDTSATEKYKFGKGSAPTTANAALGNMGPLIINKLPFASSNAYQPKQPSAPAVGAPGKKFSKYLTQRSNARFTAISNQPNAVGKIVLGYRKDQSQLLIILQPHETVGVSISQLRDLCLKIGLDSAVYLDGSDSVMLMLDNNMIISQGPNKNETNVTGIGFRY